MEKNKALVILLLSFLVIESMFHLNVYVMIILIVAVFAVLWYEDSSLMEEKSLKKNQKLMNQRNISDKEAYLKQKQLMTIIKSIPFPVFLLDVFGKIPVYNDACNQVRCGHMTEVTYSKNDFHPLVQEFMKDSFILEERLEKMLTIQEKEYQAVSIPVTTKGIFSGCVIMLQDISKALEGEKMQKAFIADASHELKTPISVMKGMVEILNREDFDDDETRKDFLHQIESETKRLENIVADLLQLSRLSVNPILNRKSIDIHALIDDVLESLSYTAEMKGLHFVREYYCKDDVFCDKEKMSQVLTNLVSNAIKYSDFGNITIQTNSDDKYFILHVIDEGIGISEKDCARIFERFYRVDKDRSRLSGGSGLGLSIVKSIVEAHNGTISVESTLNEGTIFTIKLKN